MSTVRFFTNRIREKKATIDPAYIPRIQKNNGSSFDILFSAMTDAKKLFHSSLRQCNRCICFVCFVHRISAAAPPAAALKRSQEGGGCWIAMHIAHIELERERERKKANKRKHFQCIKAKMKTGFGGSAAKAAIATAFVRRRNTEQH